MKYFNLGVQSLLAIGVLVAVIFGELSIVLLLQLIIGVWQFGDALRHLIWIRYERIIRVYLIIASMYLLAFIVLVAFNSPVAFQWLLLPSWLLAIYYYTITWRKTFVITKNTSSFLPHVNF